MLGISTLSEALSELAERTGRVWTDSEIFDAATKQQLQLHASVPLSAQTVVREFVVGEGLIEKFKMPAGDSPLAVLFPWQVAQLWISGETETSHPSNHDSRSGVYVWFTEPVRVTREQVRIKAATLKRILMLWRNAQGAAVTPKGSPAQVQPAARIPTVSNAPEPIRPVRGSSRVLSLSLQSPKWHVWKNMPSCALWEAVCLTCDIEPDDERHDIAYWLQSKRGVPHGFPTDFADRLKVAQANVSSRGPIEPLQFYLGVGDDPRAKVRLADFARFAIACGWQIPDDMRTLADPAELEAGAKQEQKKLRELDAMRVPGDGGMSARTQWLSNDARPEPQAEPGVAESAEKAPAGKPDRAPTAPVFSMTKAALIDAHEHEWPTIRRDVQDAKENGLAAAAKAGARGWYELKALAWARAKGKLNSAHKPADALAQAMRSMGSLSGRKHTL